MQVITHVHIGPKEYLDKFKELDLKPPEHCPFCGAFHSFHRHGRYFRNALDSDSEERIPIARFICTACPKGQRHTVSLLPSFVLPYFQYSLSFIISALKAVLLMLNSFEQRFKSLLRFYRKRFFHNLNRLEMFFRDEGRQEIHPPDQKEKAIKLICMVCTFPKAETFSQRFHQLYKRNFMAH